LGIAGQSKKVSKCNGELLNDFMVEGFIDLGADGLENEVNELQNVAVRGEHLRDKVVDDLNQEVFV
jgi:hypothetical protein